MSFRQQDKPTLANTRKGEEAPEQVAGGGWLFFYGGVFFTYG